MCSLEKVSSQKCNVVKFTQQRQLKVRCNLSILDNSKNMCQVDENLLYS